MPTARSLVAGLALALTAISCSDQSTTAPNDQKQPPSFAKRTQTGPIVQTVTGTLSNGGTFVGQLTLQSITQQGGQLLASGTISGTQTLGGVETPVALQTFSAVPLSLVPNNGTCPILHLDLGPIHLDLLGLQVDLSQVVLDITAQSGAGNLLGNLLCAVAHLLDQSPIDLSALNLLLAQINAILGAIL